MSVLRYPRSAVIADLCRAAIGGAATCAPLALAEPAPWLRAVLLAMLALFAVHAAGAARRAFTVFELGDAGLGARSGRTRIEWRDLDALDLGYYSTRRDGRSGWMELRLRAGGRSVRVDSRLAGFDAVLERALGAAQARGVALDATTRANLAAAGLIRAEPSS